MLHPEELQVDEAVADAMQVFWEYGFNGTSFDDLEDATGMSRSALTNAYGNKLDLFCEALDAYEAGPSRELSRPLFESRGADALRGYLDNITAFVISPEGTRGCLVVNTAVGEELCEDVTQKTRAHFSAIRAAMRRAYMEALDDGEVNPEIGAEEAADWLVTIVRGVFAGAVSGEGTRTLTAAIARTKMHFGILTH